MKQLLYFSALLFAIIACDQDLTSLEDTSSDSQQASEAPDYQRRLKEMVAETEQQESKTFGSKKSESFDLVDTVGGEKIGTTRSRTTIEAEQSVTVTHEVETDVVETDRVVSEHRVVQEIQTVVEETPVVANIEVRLTDSVKEPEPKLDLLFYMQTRDSACVRNLSSYFEENNFLSHIRHFDWQIAFSYYFQGGNLAFLPLEYRNGQGVQTGWFENDHYVLSEKDYHSDSSLANKLFYMTLKPVHPRSSNPNGTYEVTEPDSNGTVQNPLSGLKYILSNNPVLNERTCRVSQKCQRPVRSDSHIIVVLIDYDYPFYSPAQWQTFFNQHENVSMLAASSRLANVSNLFPGLKKNDRFNFVPICENRGSPGNLLEAIKNQMEK